MLELFFTPRYGPIKQILTASNLLGLKQGYTNQLNTTHDSAPISWFPFTNMESAEFKEYVIEVNQKDNFEATPWTIQVNSNITSVDVALPYKDTR